MGLLVSVKDRFIRELAFGLTPKAPILFLVRVCNAFRLLLFHVIN